MVGVNHTGAGMGRRGGRIWRRGRDARESEERTVKRRLKRAK